MDIRSDEESIRFIEGVRRKKAEVFGQMDIQTILEKSPKEKLDRIKWIRWYISCGDDDFLSVTNCL